MWRLFWGKWAFSHVNAAKAVIFTKKISIRKGLVLAALDIENFNKLRLTTTTTTTNMIEPRPDKEKNQKRSNCRQWMQMMGLKGVFSSFVIGLIWRHKVLCSRVVLLLVSSIFDRMRGLQCREVLLLVSLLGVTFWVQGGIKAEDAAIQFNNQWTFNPPPHLSPNVSTSGWIFGSAEVEHTTMGTLSGL